MEKPISVNYNLDLPSAHAITGEVLATGDGAATDFDQSLNNSPIIPGSASFTDGTETFSDNGDGTLTGDQGGSGTIDYYSGDVSLSFNAAPADTQDITSDYDRIPSAVNSVTDEDKGVAADLAQEDAYSGTFEFNGELDEDDIIPGSFVGTVDFSSTSEEYTDDGEGIISGANLQFGYINYDTGEFKLVWDTEPDASANFLVDYSHGNETANEKILATDLKGIYSVRIENQQDSDIFVGFAGGPDLENLSILESKVVEANYQRTIQLVGPIDLLKVFGQGKFRLRFSK